MERKTLIKVTAITVVVVFTFVLMDFLVFSGRDSAEDVVEDGVPDGYPVDSVAEGDGVVSRDVEDFGFSGRGKCVFVTNVVSMEVSNLTGECVEFMGDVSFGGERQLLRGSVSFTGFSGDLSGDVQGDRFVGEISGSATSGSIEGVFGTDAVDRVVSPAWIVLLVILSGGGFAVFWFRGDLFGGGLFGGGDSVGGSARYDKLFQDYFREEFNLKLDLLGGVIKDQDGVVVAMYLVEKAPLGVVEGGVMEVRCEGSDIFHRFVDSESLRDFSARRVEQGGLNWLNRMRKYEASKKGSRRVYSSGSSGDDFMREDEDGELFRGGVKF